MYRYGDNDIFTRRFNMTDQNINTMKYKDLLKNYEATQKGIYLEMIVARMKKDEYCGSPTFAVEDMPKSMGEAVDYYLEHYFQISNRRNYDYLTTDRGGLSLYKSVNANITCLELRNSVNLTLSYRILLN